MNRIASRLLVFMTVLAASGGIVSAQGIDQHHDHTAPLCGTATMERLVDPERMMEELRRENPEEYRRAMAEAKQPRHSRIVSADDYPVFEFYVSGSGPTPNTVTAILWFQGKYTRLWIDVRDTARLLAPARRADMLKVLRALDTATHPTQSRNPNKGIVENNIDWFGPEPTTVVFDPGTDFLLTDLPNPGIIGYFSGTDQQKKTQYPYSNEMNMLYVDSRQGFSNLEVLLSTIAHEHQHLIHHGRNALARSGGRSDVSFYNEGLAELASILNGYYDRTVGSYMANTNVDMFRFSGGSNPTEQDQDYTRATTLLTYLYETFGLKFIYDFVGLTDVGMLRINSALELSGFNLSVDDWRAVIRNYTVANYVKTAPAEFPWYGFRHANIKNARVNPAGTYTGTDYPRTNEITLQRNGIAYYVYNNPGYLTFRYSANRPAEIMAIFYKDNEFHHVERLATDTDYELGRWGGPYSKIALGVIAMSTDNGTTQVNVTATPLTVGVRESELTGQFLIAPVAPNPINDVAIFRFSAAAGEDLQLELFDGQGARMNTIFQGKSTGTDQMVRFDASALPSGVYMLRLRQGDRITTRPVVVAR